MVAWTWCPEVSGGLLAQINNGNGTYSSSVITTTYVGGGFCTADINRDGKIDVVYAENGAAPYNHL